MGNNSTEHFNIIKPDPETPVSEDVHTIRTAFDLIDALLKVISEAVTKKAEQGHTHDFAGVEGLEEALGEFRRKDEDINVGDLSDVLNPEDAQLNYVLTKTAAGFAFSSALSVLGEHQHSMANVVGLQDVLNSFVSGSAGSLDGEIPIYQGTSGKAVKRGGVTLASILQDIAGKAATSHAHSADNIVSGTFADARIPSLNASKITAGVFADARIPSLSASKTTAGVFAEARIPPNVGLAVGQTWVNVSSQRLANTAYRNTTGRVILIAADFNNSWHDIQFEVSDNGTSWTNVYNIRYSCVVPVQHNQYYKITRAANNWKELR